MSLNVGDKAPDFVAKDQDGIEVTLASFKGKKLIIFFYPKDNTPGCTMQACNLRDNYSLLLEQGYSIVGVSADSQASHQKFRQKKNLPFPLLVDENHEICESFGVWAQKSLFVLKFWGIKRTTFIIDEKGYILDIIDKVKVRDHAQQILK